MGPIGEKELRKQAAKYAARVMMQRIIGLACFLLAAGTLADMRGWIYFSIYFIVSIITLVIMLYNRAETLIERGKKHVNTKSWDKICVGVYVPSAFFVIYIVAGLDIRFGWSHLPISYLYGGIVIYAISTVMGIWPVMENKHFESMSRIQSDRKQTVIAIGPYRFARHPGYLSIIIWALAVPMIFGSLYSGLITAAIIITIIIRTYLEDAMLKNELSGYLEYASKVKYRLMPFIW
ncbi:MAG: isoprenylcysteine carboxylmethyltransferase family protein [Clostridiales bacterium]|jgi:protein-S-isoprenylcysteine O-methyltransferase Ste14|nr:isoprenylcysteine carboxylmethyltransferase family protein [Clostridiales bacterium]